MDSSPDASTADLVAAAVGDTSYGSRFFRLELIQSLDMEERNGKLKIRCGKRNRWLVAKPEEVVRQLVLQWVQQDLAYPIHRIAVEWPIQMGSDAEKERADIVVFSDDAQTDPFIMFEVKRPSVSDGLEQLRSYLWWTGSFFGCWSNGNDIVFILREEDQESRKGPYTFRDIPRLPSRGESLDEILTPLRPVDLRPVQDLRALVMRLEHDALSNAGVTAFDELLKLFFAKLDDEIRPKSQLKQPCRFRVASADDEQLYERFNGLFLAARSRPNMEGIFDAGDTLKLTGDALRLCASALEPLTLARSHLGVIDAAFEYLVNPEQKGQKGQYFTPRHVVRMAVSMLDPQDDERVIDPACGSGGFLIHTLEHVSNVYDLTPGEAYRYASDNLYGVDFDEKLVRVAKLSMIIAGDGKANIFRTNSLDVRAWQNSAAARRIGEFSKDVVDGNFDILLTNPPFSGKVSGKTQLRAFDLYDLASEGRLSGGNEDPDDQRGDEGRNGAGRRITSMKRDICN